jgi:hypothetical protein
VCGVVGWGVAGEDIDEGGDPPRIWSKYGEYPGTAFTRSLGDSIAEELGVYAGGWVGRRAVPCRAVPSLVVVARRSGCLLAAPC